MVDSAEAAVELNSAQRSIPPPGPASAAGQAAVTLAPLTREGVRLARLVLWFVAAATVLILALAIWEDVGTGSLRASADKGLQALAAQPFPVGDGPNLAALQKVIDSSKALLDAVAAQQRDTRDFVMKIAQLILLNLFLPVLTAILGYIFGTRQAGGAADRGG